MTPRLHLPLACIVGCLLLLSLPSAGLPLSCVIDGRYTMGTVLQLTLCGTDPDQTRRTSDSLFQTAARLDRLLTTYAPDSPVSRLNATAGQGAMPVPAEVMDALSLSVRYWELTGGTFDITVGPLMALWKRASGLPSPDTVRHTLSRVGSHRIVLSPQGTVALAQHMALDLGGIGKGFALDRMVALLKERRVGRALLNFGHSSQWAVGRPPDAPGWRLLVRLPDGTITGIATLRDQALSVSGSLGQSVALGDRRYGHVIDPRTGQPIQRDLLACVVAPSAAQAEALSKALLILGESEGTALLERLSGVEGLLLETNGRRWETKGWQQAVSFVAL